LVSAAAVAFEIALTRYFAVAKWSEYGYWVISIVMVGFAMSGVVVALARRSLQRHAERIMAILPPLLILTAAGGFYLTTINPFNPLQLQNPATFAPQLMDIGLYYAELLPFFFLAGLFVSLTFVANAHQVGLVYGYDLTGAGAGALGVLLLMFVLHPFQLLPALLLPLAAAAVLLAWRRPLLLLSALAALVASEALLLLDNQAAINDFKAIYAPSHVPDSQTLSQLRSPRGLYTLLDDFTERLDTDVSNNLGNLGLPGPPQTFGLYRDGNRIAALPKAGGATADYAAAALSALPYELLHNPQVLLVGGSGGFRLREALTLGASDVLALEPEPVLRGALRHGLGPSPGFGPEPKLRISADSPLAAVADETFDLIDISADFLDASEANAYAFTSEAIEADLRALRPGGILSIPVSIREFPAYAVRMLATVRQALLSIGADRPSDHVIVYRSAWNLRILVSNHVWEAKRIAAVRRFCDDRSFDVSFYPGIDIVAARAGLYNDLPSVSFEAGEVTSGAGPDDAIADEAGQVLNGEPTTSGEAFNLSPISFDRPFFYDVLKLQRLRTILARIEILPQAEIAPLVNLAVLGQAVVFACLVLLVPIVMPRRRRQVMRAGFSAAAPIVNIIVYFAALGLGFLFIEITLIEKVAFYLNDRTSSFALVLTAMLISSGVGSLISPRFAAAPKRGVALAGAVVVLWCLLVMLFLQDFLLATIALPWLARAAIVLVLVAPVSVALGLPFPLGLAQTELGGGGLMPWAWALNGGFSVVATPLANLIALEAGFSRVLLGAAVLYGVCYISFPSVRKSVSWQDLAAQSGGAE
jgi:spermidine synthase